MKKVPYLLLVPAVLACLLVSVWPILQVGHLSFFKSNYITTVFIGLRNYIGLFHDEIFLNRLSNSLLYALYMTAGNTAFVLVVSLMVFNMSKRVQSVIRFVFYIPVFAAGVILSMVWRWIFHPVAGMGNWLLGLLNIAPVIWMGNRHIAIAAISFILVISNAGGALVIYLAAMLSIPTSAIESARIDGASWLQIKLRIVVPIIAPTIYLMSTLMLIGAFMVFETIYLMSPIEQAQNMMLDIYRTAFNYSHYGLASAKSIVLMGIILAIAVIKRRLESGK